MRIIRNAAWLVGTVVLLEVAISIDDYMDFYKAAHLDVRTPLLVHFLVWFVVGLYTAMILIENISTLKVKPHVLIFISLPCLILTIYFFIQLYASNSIPMPLMRAFYGDYVQTMFGASIMCGFFGTFRVL